MSNISDTEEGNSGLFSILEKLHVICSCSLHIPKALVTEFSLKEEASGTSLSFSVQYD